jgi:hypothetical protein
MLRKLLMIAITSGLAAKLLRQLLEQKEQPVGSTRTEGTPGSADEVEAVQAWRQLAANRSRADHAASLASTAIPPDIP